MRDLRPGEYFARSLVAIDTVRSVVVSEGAAFFRSLLRYSIRFFIFLLDKQFMGVVLHHHHHHQRRTSTAAECKNDGSATYKWEGRDRKEKKGYKQSLIQRCRMSVASESLGYVLQSISLITVINSIISSTPSSSHHHQYHHHQYHQPQHQHHVNRMCFVFVFVTCPDLR